MATTPLQQERALQTEAKMIEKITKEQLIKALAPVFGLFSTQRGLHNNLIKLAKEELLTISSLIEAISLEFAEMNAEGFKKSEVTKMVKEAVGLGGTIKDTNKATLNKSIQAISNQFRRLSASGVATADIQKAILGTKAQGYNDGVVGQIARSEKLATDIGTRLAKATAEDRSRIRDKGIIGYIWHTTFENSCPTCMALSAKKFYYAKSGAKPLPPLHPNCRCYTTPIYKDGSHKDVETFKEWSDKPENQDELLESVGPSRYDLIKKGKLKIERFSSVDYEPLNLEELKKRSGIAFKKAGL